MNQRRNEHTGGKNNEKFHPGKKRRKLTKMNYWVNQEGFSLS